ncbi:MAG: hypothetical protein ABIH41_05640 [Nanoarchaeota archaeon]
MKFRPFVVTRILDHLHFVVIERIDEQGMYLLVECDAAGVKKDGGQLCFVPFIHTDEYAFHSTDDFLFMVRRSEDVDGLAVSLVLTYDSQMKKFLLADPQNGELMLFAAEELASLFVHHGN